VPTIVEAARQAQDKPIDWVLIGSGQEEERVRRMLKSQSSLRVTWIPWVPYDHLIDELAKADVCLGIFGDSAKAGRVIPNKVFQILSTGRPLVTRDSPAIRELIPNDHTPGVELVPPADPEALVAAVERLARSGTQPPRELCAVFSIAAIGERLAAILAASSKADSAEGRDTRSTSR
jgi:glycosyltransferase involved in cell wall biosynthesis